MCRRRRTAFRARAILGACAIANLVHSPRLGPGEKQAQGAHVRGQAKFACLLFASTQLLPFCRLPQGCWLAWRRWLRQLRWHPVDLFRRGWEVSRAFTRLRFLARMASRCPCPRLRRSGFCCSRMLRVSAASQNPTTVACRSCSRGSTAAALALWRSRQTILRLRSRAREILGRVGCLPCSLAGMARFGRACVCAPGREQRA